jgi:hypothetical protein
MRNKDESSVYFTFISRQHTEPSSDVTLCLICPICQSKLWRPLKHAFAMYILPRRYELLMVTELLSPVRISFRDCISHVATCSSSVPRDKWDRSDFEQIRQILQII